MEVDVTLQVELGGESLGARVAGKDATVRVNGVTFPGFALFCETLFRVSGSGNALLSGQTAY